MEIISKGYILVYCTGEYEDSHESLLVFSKNENDLKDLEAKFNNEIHILRKKWNDTEELRHSYFECFKDYFKDIEDNYPDSEQFDEFLKNFPIPEELDELVFEESEVDGEKEYFYLGVIDYDYLYSHYSIRELRGLE